MQLPLSRPVPPGMLKDWELIIQGNLSFELEAHLFSTYDIPKHLIDSKAPKGAKPKKN